MGSYEVVGHTGWSVHKEGEVYSIRGGKIVLRVAERGESLDGIQNLCYADTPELSEEGEQLPETIEDVLFQNAII